MVKEKKKIIHRDDRQEKKEKEDKCSSIRNDQSIGLLRKEKKKNIRDNHVRRMRIREESITLNISSRAISDCCWRSNLPDRNREEKKKKKKKNEGNIEQKQIVLMDIDKKKRRRRREKKNESDRERPRKEAKSWIDR